MLSQPLSPLLLLTPHPPPHPPTPTHIHTSHPTQDTVSFDGRPQRYRESKGKLQAALEAFAQKAGEQQFVLTLGDLIDGYKDNPDTTAADLHMVAQMFDSQLPITKVHHVLGNHCLNASREDLRKVRQ
jgi:hypothetical protein